ncbi:MAG: hypothetical protein V9G04_10025 [Nocardioides sp.]|jgi:hypothetical protein
MITYDTDASIYSPTLAVRECIESAFRVARELLPEIPADITVEFKDRPEQSGVGVSGYPRTVGVVVLAWDTEFPDPLAQLSSLRTEVLHQAYHWSQGYTFESPTVTAQTALDIAVYEGAATAFAREHSTTTPLWSDYDPLAVSTLQSWRNELETVPVVLYASTRELWRQWAGPQADPNDSWRTHRVGTWIVDQYMARSGTSPVDLRHLPPNEILEATA